MFESGMGPGFGGPQHWVLLTAFEDQERASDDGLNTRADVDESLYRGLPRVGRPVVRLEVFRPRRGA